MCYSFSGDSEVKCIGIASAIILIYLALYSCANANGPAEMIDYARSENWASLPSVKNNSMLVPDPMLKSQQGAAEADVFYIYPTVYISFFSNNASIDDTDYREDVSNFLLTTQASSLNNIGKIYTPYYRQASLWAYLDTEEARKKALDIAYSDVESAFHYYLEHYNQGRPLFILSHSQGSQVAVRLLREYYTRFHLGRILVAAYIIGERVGTRTFAGLKPCTAAAQTNCFVTWGTVAQGGNSEMMTGHIRGTPVCVNPLSWRMDNRVVSSSHHHGGVPDTFDKIRPHLVSAKCDRGLLNIEPAPVDFSHDGKDYHESDINLFYMDIRHNAEVRFQQYLRENAKANSTNSRNTHLVWLPAGVIPHIPPQKSESFARN